MKSFGSDNHAGVLPEVLDALKAANEGAAVAYGNDPWTERATERFKSIFGDRAKVFFVFNGTAANVLSLQAGLRPHHAILCSESSHIQSDECGAPERFIGCKLIPVAAPLGKLSPEALARHLHGLGDQHHVQPRAVSISQTTELGTVYKPAEIKALSVLARSHGMFLHLDGARICNAAASLGVGFAEMTVEAGVDVLSFGGTKAGLMGAEAVVILNPGLAGEFRFLRKQAMQLASKMRFVSAQFLALLEGDLGLRSAKHANAMSKLLENELRGVNGIEILFPVEANAIFARVSKAAVPEIQKKFFFHVWKSESTHDIVRWMTAFNTTEAEVKAFAAAIRAAV